MKRSLGKTTAPLPLYWPDDLFVEILPRVYQGRIHSVEELARLISLAVVSKQFCRVLWANVAPSIRFIGSKVLEKKSATLIVYFPNVDELEMTPTLMVKKELYECLPSLKKLSFSEECLFTRFDFPLRWLTTLEALSTRPLLWNGTLGQMTQLKYLDLSQEMPVNRDKAVSSLVSLEVLKLCGDACITDSTLTRLSSLHTLGLRDCHTVTDAGLLTLANQLTDLDLRRNDVITGGCLTQLVNLNTLCLRSNYKIKNRHLSKLTGLTSLNIKDNGKIGLASVSRLTSLKTLAFDYGLYGPGNGLRPLTNLESLTQAGRTPFATLSAMKTMRNLRHLVVDIKEKIGAEFVARRPLLTRLVVPAKNLVTKRAREMLRERGGGVERIDAFVKGW